MKLSSSVALRVTICLLFDAGQMQMMGKSMVELKALLRWPKKERGSVTNIATRLGLARHHELIVPDWLAPTDKDKLPRQDRVSFPKPPKAPGIQPLPVSIKITFLSNILRMKYYYRRRSEVVKTSKTKKTLRIK